MTPEEQERSPTTNQSAAERTEDQEQTRIPLLAEEVSVSKKRITGQLKISSVTQQDEPLVEELLGHDNVEIERAAVGREVDLAATVREDGDALIIPIMEEVVVVQRRRVCSSVR